jgi:prolyl-tRNA editing enzyme YbaK/EbsC (Cys-tRNA(Pro) deacylase)
MTFLPDIKYGEIIQHRSSGFNIDDVAKELSIKKENIVKAILLDYRDEKPVLFIIRVVDKLSSKNMKILFGKKYSFMKNENLERLNLSPGAIPPFIGFIQNFKTFIDRKLLEKEYYYGSGGSLFSACKFLVDDYLKLGAEITILTFEQI